MFELSNPLLGALLIFVIRVLSIAVSTLRLLLMGRANPLLVFTLSFIEAASFVLTFGVVAQDLTNMYNLMSYSLGFAAGTWVGTLIEERVGAGFATVNIVSRGKSLLIVEAVREAGYGATRTAGEGVSGSVGLVWVVVRRRNVGQIVGIVQKIEPKAFISVDETRSVRQGFLGYGRA